MAKPILLFRLPDEFRNEGTKLREYAEKQLDNEYHILIIASSESQTLTIECFNDVKGLPDIDIEALIKSIKNGEA